MYNEGFGGGTSLEKYEDLIHSLKERLLVFLKENDAKETLLDSVNRSGHLEELVSGVRVIEGGQLFALNHLKSLDPDLMWYRGGTKRKFEEVVSPANHEYFTEEDLGTQIIDGGKNGVLGKREIAEGFLDMAAREDPVIYSLTLDDLIAGLEDEAIRLYSEHEYDLCVAEVDRNREKYLEFCRDRLNMDR